MYRFSISLSSDLSVEELRIALYNYILSKQKNDNFTFVFDDTDSKDTQLVEILRFLGFEFDKPMYASESLKFYRGFTSKMLENKKAFCCFCKNVYESEYSGACKHLSDDEVIGNENPFSIRIKRPLNPIKINDSVKGELIFEPRIVDDFILLKTDKYPSFDFINGVSDMLLNVLHVISSDEHMVDSIRQSHVRQTLGYNVDINYTHIPALKNQKDIKSVIKLLELGYLPDAIINYLLLLGSEKQDIFTFLDAKEHFKLDDIKNVHVDFCMDELGRINKEHIKMLENKKLSAMIGFSSEYVGELAKVFTKDDATLNELKVKLDSIFSKKSFTKEKKLYEKVANEIIHSPVFDDYEELKLYLVKKFDFKDSELEEALKAIFLGFDTSVELENIYKIVKKYLKEIVKW